MIGEPARQRTTRRARLLAAVLLSGAAAALLGSSPAHAAYDCTFTGSVVAIDVTDASNLTIANTGNEGKLTLSPATTECTNINLADIARIDVTTSTTLSPTDTSDQTVTINLANSTFTPGDSFEGGSSTDPEIEFHINLGGNSPTGDKLIISGNPSGIDRITMGEDGINLNADEGAPKDADIESIIGAETIELNGLGGADAISAGGDDGTGDARATAVTILGDNGSDHLIGGEGNDSITGGGDNDTLEGGGGDDTFEEGTAGNGADRIDGDDGNDLAKYNRTSGNVDVSINGEADDGATTGEGDNVDVERVTGGAGNDVFSGTTGTAVSGTANVFDGGTGTDTVTYSSLAVAVTASLDATITNAGGAAGDSFTSIENLTGGGGNDTLTGDTNDNILSGGAGDDTLNGGSHATGGDTVDYSSTTTGSVSVDLAAVTAPQATGGGGNDTISNVENLIGTAQGDTLKGDGNANILTGGEGNDNLMGRGGDDTQVGGGDTDTLDFTGRPAVTVDFVNGKTTGDAAGASDSFSGIESVLGSANDDVFKSSTASEKFDGAGGIDAADYTAAGTGTSVTVNLHTQSASGHGSDTFFNIEKAVGGAGNDTLFSSSDNDIIDGSGGTGDTVDYSLAVAGVTVNLGATTAPQATGGAGNDTLSNVENVTGTDDDDDLTGSAVANRLDGRGGHDIITAGDGNDVLIGGEGPDEMAGQTGIDTLDYSSATNVVVVNLAAGSATGQGTDTFLQTENAIGSPQNDTITGTVNDNMLTGGAGNDTLIGGDGVDSLIGGVGDDTLQAGSGGDATAKEQVTGGDGSDTADYSNTSVGLTVNLATPASNTGDAQFDNFTDTIENVTGSTGNDTLVGDGHANKLTGLAGNDELRGDLGNDTLGGGPGTDTIDGSNTTTTSGDAGSDTADYTNAGGSVTVDLVKQDPMTQSPGGGEGTDTLKSIENATGSGHDDQLTGDSTANVLKGLGGNDTFVGAGGDDTLNGGDGADDKVDYSGSTAVFVDLAKPTAPQATGVGNDTIVLNTVENVKGSTANDTIGGNASDNDLVGNGGTDMLTFANSDTGVTVDLIAKTATGAGTDTVDGFTHVIGSAQNDTLAGTTGNNTITGGGGTDTVSYANVTGTSVNVNLRTTTAQTTGAGDDTITEVENLTGSPQADTLAGTSGNNTFDGLGDTDTLTFADATAAGGVEVNLDAGTADGDGTDTVTNVENVTGSPQGDTLTGDGNDNLLFGGNGDDTIDGGGGNDTELGSSGNDSFYQGASRNGADDMSGGSGTDDVTYDKRPTTAFVTFDNVANDGEAGEGDNTRSDIETFALAVFPPDPPTNVQATAGKGSATVTWTAPANSGGTPITGYTVASNPDNKTATTGSEARSAVVTGLRNGVTYTFTVNALNSAGTGNPSAASNAVTPTDPATTQGYSLLGSDGAVYSFGKAGNFGSIPGLGITLNQPPIGISYTPSGNGYWIVAQDGGIFTFGDAGFFGSTGNVRLNAPVLGMEPTPSGKGYWLFAGDGGIFSFGDAQFFGSMGASKLNAPVVGMGATSTGKGYWLVAQDGGIFSFGDAQFFGSTGNIRLNQPVFDMAPMPDNAGYRLVARDGGLFSFGSAESKFFGSAANANPATVIGIANSPSGNGYWIVDRNGVVYAFGDASALGDLRGLGKTAVGFSAPR